MKIATTILRSIVIACVVLPICGCQSYVIVQSNIFSDDDGNVVRVDYGRSDEKHENYYENPTNGQKEKYLSNLVIDVYLPDGDSLTAWECMNFTSEGTMYKTDNDRWMIQVTGFSCRVYRMANRNLYREVYRGILCDSPKVDYTPDPKWRKLKKDSQGQWR